MLCRREHERKLVAVYGVPVYHMCMASRFDHNKDSTNLKAHKLSLAFGDRIFQDDNQLIIPSVRPEDREERFKVVGVVDQKLFTGVFTWRDELPCFISVRRSN